MTGPAAPRRTRALPIVSAARSNTGVSLGATGRRRFLGLAAGAAAVSVGGPLLGDALKGGSMVELAARAREVVDAVQDAR